MGCIHGVSIDEKGAEFKMKKTINLAFLYAILAMVSGVFYREFTKLSGFTGRTALSFAHTHLFLLGMMMFLIVTFFIRLFAIQESKKYKAFLWIYNAGVHHAYCPRYFRG